MNCAKIDIGTCKRKTEIDVCVSDTCTLCAENRALLELKGQNFLSGGEARRDSFLSKNPFGILHAHHLQVRPLENLQEIRSLTALRARAGKRFESRPIRDRGRTQNLDLCLVRPQVNRER